MKVLGITHSHNSTVALLNDGELIFAQSEERLNRIKNSTGFPVKTLDWVYENIYKPEEIDLIVIFEESLRGYLFLKKNEFKSFQYGTYLSNKDNFKSAWRKSWAVWKLAQFYFKYFIEKNYLIKNESYRYFEKVCKSKINKIKFVDHHAAHAYSTLGGILNWGDTIIFTLDAVGDYKCATVSLYKNNSIKKISSDDYSNSLGNYFATITSLLGMKAGEHEFKIMGLAPYANRKYYENILKEFKKLIYINEKGQFISKIPPKGLIDTLFKIIRHQRFDNVAGAIQELTENLILEWVSFWCKKIKCKNIAVSGGVFMNVKACQKVSELDVIDKLYVMPSAGDESNAIGAAYWGHINLMGTSGLKPLKSLYLGAEYSDKEINKVFEEQKINSKFNIQKPDDLNDVASTLLANGEVVARLDGKMEFGARALGNRSILSNPKDFRVIEKINSLIKIRDFWMPFTPSILEEDLDKYIINPKRIFAPYMCITFNTTELAKEHISAAIHPRDKTVRPQCLVKSWNPKYYDLIVKFKSKTGIGALLNTSFNLHGEPNVCSPKDALNTFEKSGLEHLIIGDYLISKQK